MLSELFNTIDVEVSEDVEIGGIKTNSTAVEDGDLFLCTKGAHADRHDFVDDAVSRGARAVITSRDLITTAVCVRVPDVDAVADLLFQKFYDYPQNELEMYAVTGTDGKTTTAWILQQLLGINYCGNIGTNGVVYCGRTDPSLNTTPDSDKVYAYLRGFKNSGLKAAVVEMSSEAVHYNRLQNLKFGVVGYTNVTSEHLNTHKTVEKYVQAKIEVFRRHLSSSGGTNRRPLAVINDDDHYSQRFKRAVVETFAGRAEIATYGVGESCTLQILDRRTTSRGTEITFSYAHKEYKILSPLFGDYNAYNLALALLMCIGGGYALDKLLKNLRNLHIPGRFEVLDFGSTSPKVVVDFAHTPNAVANVLKFVSQNKHTQALYGSGRIITVIGQPGERDAIKRPEVGKVAGKYSDHIIFTADDPRSESVEKICSEIISGIDQRTQTEVSFEVVVDREEAIVRAKSLATSDDIIMVLGKGAEKRQKIGGVDIEYSDVDAVRKIFGGEEVKC
ncbi:MAG: UDP-N-acetylmuramoyl-L-alanyl-D-glutamate--2,6-diaminopimelate ligase [Candidatus Ancillula trichonymphae]|jgi:UDP-N-acetylmuramoyl-L-alanyl-D-glutamate--2,6-diaminopimelate ligase|nr:UDP-N-acetylmuramoyl-L-alanyl-D-glutamate--2,6-diaminopimelate ligase [Candidatus Ancillula trichonymphae]